MGASCVVSCTVMGGCGEVLMMLVISHPNYVECEFVS